MKDMYIPNLFDVPKVKVDPKAPVTGTMSRKVLMSMIGALNDVGLVVRHEDGAYICQADGKDILRARKGKNGTYLTRYAPGVTKLVVGKK